MRLNGDLLNKNQGNIEVVAKKIKQPSIRAGRAFTLLSFSDEIWVRAKIANISTNKPVVYDEGVLFKLLIIVSDRDWRCKVKLTLSTESSFKFNNCWLLWCNYGQLVRYNYFKGVFYYAY